MRFTLHGDPDGRLSACADGPSGRDVDCRVHVRVRLVSAGYALEDRLALAVLSCAMPTGTAGLRRVRRVRFIDPSRCPVLQTTHQAVCEDAAVESGFRAATVRQIRARLFGGGLRSSSFGHLGDVQILHPDDVEPSGDVGACLLHPVPATVTGSGVQPGDRYPHPLTPVGAATAAGQATLQVLEPLPLTVRQTRAGQDFTSRQCRRHGHTAIHTDHLTRIRGRNGPGDDSERQVPAPDTVAGDAVRLRVGNGAGQPEPDPADLGHVDRGPLPVHFHDPGRLTANDAEPLVQPGSAPSRSTVGPAVEVSDSLIEVPHCLLLDGGGPGPQPVEGRLVLRSVVGTAQQGPASAACRGSTSTTAQAPGSRHIGRARSASATQPAVRESDTAGTGT